jgi:probable HAF family extracellular repeat protein
MAFLCVSMITHGAAASTRYTLSALPLPDYASYGMARAINDHDEIVGTAHLSGDAVVPVVWRRNALVLLNMPANQIAAYPTSINNAGTIVGTFIAPGSGPGVAHWERNGVLSAKIESGRAYAWSINDAGQITGSNDDVATVWGESAQITVVTSGSIAGTASGINNLGQVVGVLNYNDGRRSRPFLYDDGVIIDLSAWGSGEGSADAINERGNIVGSSENSAGVPHATMWFNGTVRDLGVLPGHFHSYAYGLNDDGKVVGYSAEWGGRETAFLWDGEAMRDLNDLVAGAERWHFAYALDINSTGSIVGWGYHDGTAMPFLLTPILDNTNVPEPSGLVALVCGVAITGRRRR